MADYIKGFKTENGEIKLIDYENLANRPTEYTESEIQTMWDSVKVVTLVTFTITDPFEVGGPTGSFTAERGMTLTEWLASSYNTSHVPASFEHDAYGTVTLSGVDENYIKEGSSFEWTI